MASDTSESGEGERERECLLRVCVRESVCVCVSERECDEGVSLCV